MTFRQFESGRKVFCALLEAEAPLIAERAGCQIRCQNGAFHSGQHRMRGVLASPETCRRHQDLRLAVHVCKFSMHRLGAAACQGLVRPIAACLTSVGDPVGLIDDHSCCFVCFDRQDRSTWRPAGLHLITSNFAQVDRCNFTAALVAIHSARWAQRRSLTRLAAPLGLVVEI